jgi:hypothetical protein
LRVTSRGLGDVYKRQLCVFSLQVFTAHVCDPKAKWIYLYVLFLLHCI